LQRKVVLLRREGKSGYEVARILGVDPPAAYRAEKTARKKLRAAAEDFKDLGISSPEDILARERPTEREPAPTPAYRSRVG